jgi:hypothetical protein
MPELISLGELEVSEKLLKKQLTKVEKDIQAFQKRVGKLLTWNLTINDKDLKRKLTNASDEFDRLNRSGKRVADDLEKAMRAAGSGARAMAAQQAKAIRDMYAQAVNSAQKAGGIHLGAVAATRAAKVPQARVAGPTRLTQGVVGAQEAVAEAEDAKRVARKLRNNKAILAAERELSAAKIKLAQEELIAEEAYLAKRLVAVKGEADKELKARSDSAKKIAQITARMGKEEEKMADKTGKATSGIRNLWIGKNITAVMGGLAQGNIAGLAATAFGPMGAAAGAAFDLIKDGFMAVTAAANEFHDGVARINTLLVGNQDSIGQVGDAMDRVRMTSRDTGQSLTVLQDVFYNLIGSVPALQHDMNAVASLTDKVGKAATGFGASADEISIAMSNVANAMHISLVEEENQQFVLDSLGRMIVDGVVPNMHSMSNAISQGATNFGMLSSDAKSGMKGLMAFDAVLTLNGLNIDTAQDKINDFSREFLNVEKRTKLAKLGMEGINLETGKIDNWGALFKSASKDVEKFANVMTGVKSQILLRMFAANDASQINEMLAKQEHAAGTAEAQFAKITGSAKNNVDRLKTEFNDLLVTMGASVTESTSGMVGNIASAIGWINDLLASAEELNDRAQQGLKEARKANEEAQSILDKTDKLTGAGFLSEVKNDLLELQALNPTIGANIERMINAVNATDPTNIAEVRKQLEMIATIKAAESVGKLTEAIKASKEAVKEGATIDLSEIMGEQRSTLDRILSGIGAAFTGNFSQVTADNMELDFKSAGEAIKSQIASIQAELIAVTPAQLTDPDESKRVEELRDRLASLTNASNEIQIKQIQNTATIREGIDVVVARQQDLASATQSQLDMDVLRSTLEKEIVGQIAEGNSQRQVAEDIVNSTLASLSGTLSIESDLNTGLRQQAEVLGLCNDLTENTKDENIQILEAYIAQEQAKLSGLNAQKIALGLEQQQAAAAIATAMAHNDVNAAVRAGLQLASSKITGAKLDVDIGNVGKQISGASARLAALKGEEKQTKRNIRSTNDLSDSEEKRGGSANKAAKEAEKAAKHEASEAKKIAEEKEKREEEIANALEKIEADRYQSETKRNASAMGELEGKLYEEERRYRDQQADLRKQFGEHAGLMAAAARLHAENVLAIQQDAAIKAAEEATKLDEERLEHRKEVGEQFAQMRKDELEVELSSKEGAIQHEIRAESDKYSELIKMARKYGYDVTSIENLRFKAVMRIYRTQIKEISESISGTMDIIFPKSELLKRVAELDMALRAKLGQGGGGERQTLKTEEVQLNARRTELESSVGIRLFNAAETRYKGIQAAVERGIVELSQGLVGGVGRTFMLINTLMERVFGPNGFERITVANSAMINEWQAALGTLETQESIIRGDLDRITALTQRPGAASAAGYDRLLAHQAKFQTQLNENLVKQHDINENLKQATASLAAVATNSDEANKGLESLISGKLASIVNFMQGLSEGRMIGTGPEALGTENQSAADALARRTAIASLKAAKEAMEALRSGADESGTALTLVKTRLTEIADQLQQIDQEAPLEAVTQTALAIDNYLAKLAAVLQAHIAINDEISSINKQYDDLSDEKDAYLTGLKGLLDLRKRAGELNRESARALSIPAGQLTAKGLRTSIETAQTEIDKGRGAAINLGEIANIRVQLLELATQWGKTAGTVTTETIQASIESLGTMLGTQIAHEIPAQHSDPAGTQIGHQVATALIDDAPAISDAILQQRHMRNETEKQIAANQIAEQAVTLGPQGIVEALFSAETVEALKNNIEQVGEKAIGVTNITAKEVETLNHSIFKFIEREAKRVQDSLEAIVSQADQAAGRGSEYQNALKQIEGDTKANLDSIEQMQVDSREAQLTAEEQLQNNLNVLRMKYHTQAEKDQINADIKVLQRARDHEKDTQKALEEGKARVIEDKKIAKEKELIKELTKAIETMASFLAETTSSLADFLGKLSVARKEQDSQSVLGAVSSGISGAGKAVGGIARMFPGMGGVVGDAIEGMTGAIGSIIDTIASIVGGDKKLTDLEKTIRYEESINSLLETRSNLMQNLIALGDQRIDTMHEQAKATADLLKIEEQSQFGQSKLSTKALIDAVAASDQALADINFNMVQDKRNAEEAGIFDKAYYDDIVKNGEDALSIEQLRNDALNKQLDLRKQLRDFALKEIEDDTTRRDLLVQATQMTEEAAARANLAEVTKFFNRAKAGNITDASGRALEFTPDELAKLQSDIENFRTQAESARRSRQDFEREVLKHQEEMSGVDTTEQVKASLESQLAQERAILATLHGQDQIIEQKRVIMQLESDLLGLQKDKTKGMDKELALLTRQREQLLLAARADKAMSADERVGLEGLQARIRARLISIGTDPAEVDRIMANMNLQAFAAGGWVEGRRGVGVPIIAGESGRERIVSSAEIARIGGPNALDMFLNNRYGGSSPAMANVSTQNSQSFGNINITTANSEDAWRHLEPRMKRFWLDQARNYEQTRGRWNG